VGKTTKRELALKARRERARLNGKLRKLEDFLMPRNTQVIYSVVGKKD
jgi:hypothetical protein